MNDVKITFLRNHAQRWFLPTDTDDVLVSIEANGRLHEITFVTEHIPQDNTRLRMFDDAYPAFELAPELFRALAIGQPDTLDGVERLLEALGYERERQGE